MDYSPPGSSIHGDSSGQNTGVGCHALLQGLFPTQGLNPGLPHCRWILCHLSHQGSPRILEWVAYLSDPGIEPGSPALQADSLPAELSGKPRGTLIPRAVLAPDIFKLLTFLIPVFTCRSSAPPSHIVLLLVGGGEDAWPPSGQTGDTGCEREGGTCLLVGDSREGNGS